MTHTEVAEGFAPGEFLKDELEARGWTQTKLADLMGRSVKVVNDIILGKRSITPRTARELGYALGTSAELWWNLENSYKLFRTAIPTDAPRRLRLHSEYPVREMINHGWINATSDMDALEKKLQEFFSPIRDKLIAHAARKSTSYTEEPTPKQTAWLCRAYHLAPGVSVGEFSDETLERAIERLKRLLPNVEDIRLIPRVLSDAGIRFLIVEPISGSKIDGVTFWLNANSPVIVLSLRYDRIDGFWHTLWHEVWHVRNRDGLRTPIVIDTNLVGKGRQRAEEKPEQERVADRFACECSIPEAELEHFIARVRPLYSRQRIRGFAARLHVHPGIVVGQLHYREDNYKFCNEMLEKVRHIVTPAARTDGWGHSTLT